MSPRALWVLRRFVVAPAVVGLTAVVWVTLPLWLLLAAALSPVLPGRWRALRLLWVVVVYLSFESVLLVVMLGLWLASGCGLRIRTPYFAGIHYELVQATLVVFFREARRVLALRIRIDGPHPARVPDRPVLVMCRHAGPGDSFILMYALLHWHHREPRVVLKNTLAWDPAIDVLLNRIPARFISSDPAVGEDFESQIADLAADLDDTINGVSMPGEVVLSRVYIADGVLNADLYRGRVIELPEEETERRKQATNPEWPIAHVVMPGVSRDQFMASHKANHAGGEGCEPCKVT